MFIDLNNVFTKKDLPRGVKGQRYSLVVRINDERVDVLCHENRQASHLVNIINHNRSSLMDLAAEAEVVTV
jgi:hypothetical protein